MALLLPCLIIPHPTSFAKPVLQVERCSKWNEKKAVKPYLPT